MSPFGFTSLIDTAKKLSDIAHDWLDRFPSGPQKEIMRKQLDEVDQSIELAKLRAAHDFGYFFCKCTWPPQIMLFQGGTSTLHKCPACGHEIDASAKIDTTGRRSIAGRMDEF